MRIRVVGVNHKTAPLPVRERLAFDEPRTAAALAELKQLYPHGQFVLLSTCNRTELYSAAPPDADAHPVELGAWLSRFCRFDPHGLTPYLYDYQDQAAVRHLLAVACSLDSMIVGEVQIPAQVRESYRRACAAAAAGKIIHRLFHCAFATSKEVYAATSIAQRRLSIAAVAVELARRAFAPLASARVLVLGAGEMGELLIRHLLDVGCRPDHVTVAARTGRRTAELATRYGVNVAIEPTPAARLDPADIVIGAAAADGFLYDKTSLHAALPGRRRKPLLLIDLAVPRNFDPALAELDDVFLYCLDDLAAVAHEQLGPHADDLAAAEQIIADNVESFLHWFGVRDVGPLVGQLRRRFHDISRAELDKFFRTERHLTPLARRQLETLVNRTVNKLLHGVIQSLHRVARERGSAEAARFVESVLQEQPR